MKKFLAGFKLYELLIIAFSAAIGIAVKPFVTAMAHLITGPLMLPGGALAGGIYMMFVIFGASLVNKRGAATLICFVQAMVVIITGIYGTHGIASIITYVLPGIAVDLLWWSMRVKNSSLISCFFGCIIANTIGVFLVNFVFFRLPAIPLLMSLVLSAFSGGLGGVLAWNLNKLLTINLKLGTTDEN